MKLILVSLVTLLVAVPAVADDKCPDPVKSAIGKAFKGAKIETCTKEKEHGHDQFEVKLTTDGGGKLEVDVAPDGKILQVEERIGVDKLPAAVRKAFSAKYPKAKAKSAEKQTADKTVTYEIAFELDGKRKEATFGEDGKFVEEE